MRKLIHAFLLASMLLSAVATVRPAPIAMASCVDGDTGDNTLVCDTDPNVGVDNGDTDVDGDLGNDDITIESGVTTVNDVEGDGAAADVSDTSDYAAEGEGGDDTITVNGSITGDVVGDNVFQDDDAGTSLVGGDDAITISDTGAAGTVRGDGNAYEGDSGNLYFDDGNDTITVDGYVDYIVAGDGNYGSTACEGDCGIQANDENDGGDDSIFIGAGGEVGPVLGEGSQYLFECLAFCGVSAYGGNDQITINGVSYDYEDYLYLPAYAGDGVYAGVLCEYACGNDLYGGADSIVVNGLAHGDGYGDGLSAYADCGEGCGSSLYGGDDSITLNGGQDGDIYGDGLLAETYCGDYCGAYAEGGDDTITINGFMEESYVSGDGIALFSEGADDMALGGNDTITINGSAYYVMGDDMFVSEAEAFGGNDTLVIAASGEVDVVAGDGITADYGQGGNDTIQVDGYAESVYGDGTETSFEPCDCGSGIDGGNDTITINGLAGEVSGDYVNDDGGNDTIIINGFAVGVYGDDAGGNGGDDTVIVNGAVVYVFGDYTEESGGSDTIIVNGSAEYVYGDNVGGNGGDDTIIINGVAGTVSGDYNGEDGGNDTITINGVVGTVFGDDSEGCAGDDTININGDVISDVFGDNAVGCGVQQLVATGGNDTVNIGAGGVSYSTACGDISVATATHRQGTVGGLIDGDYTDGDEGYDTLNFGLVTGSQDEVDSLNAYLASLNPDGGIATVNGQSYAYTNFEQLNVHAIMINAGPQRLYDDGVTLAFATAGGIQVCNGPSGLKAGLIGYDAVSKGERSFGDNGFTVALTDLGGGQYQVHVFKDGAEQINDANQDGAADSLYSFGY